MRVTAAGTSVRTPSLAADFEDSNCQLVEWMDRLRGM